MLNSVNFSGKPFHFIGIGGIGMSAIAHVLAHRKLPVSGSDLRLNHITERLQSMGAHIFINQEASNLEYFTTRATVAAGTGSSSVPSASQLPQVVCSTAINNSNPEYQAAIALGCPILHRSDVLAGLIQQYPNSIAVGGTHGKTTTSSLIGYVLLQGGLDPTVIVGGEVAAWQGNARAGCSDYLVAEADESDGSLVKFQPKIGVITNVELDHPDHYTSLDQVVETFQTFADHCQTVIGCLDCPTVRDRLPPHISYSLDPSLNADYTAEQISYTATGTIAQIRERGTLLGQIHVPLLGQHNLSNTLAAIAVARCCGLEFSAIAEALTTFSGARRRFELRGEVNQIRFIDDYAHHPSEIQVTLASARLQADAQSEARHRVVAVFQPHRYSRVQAFLPEFAQSFLDADVVVVSDIYSAGEVNPSNLSGQTLVDLISTHQSDVYYQPTLQSVQECLKTLLRPGDLAIFLGAGNLNQIIPAAIADQPPISGRPPVEISQLETSQTLVPSRSTH
ncbi:MAG: UDP-N-acetylmuramate--L-alanine ligase [Synechococcales bacterium]|nr:UDP-N-acetylmuramate--L-alanine ligase [Synechococcales bacterium]